MSFFFLVPVLALVTALQISFKSLLIVHLLSRSDAGNDVLSFCASQRGILTAAYKGGANSTLFSGDRPIDPSRMDMSR